MTITDEQARQWAQEESKLKRPKRRSRSDDLSRDLEFLLKVVSKPQVLDQLSRDRIDRLVWHIPKIFWDTQRVDGYDQQRIAVAAAIPEFFAHLFGDAIEPSSGLEMFWDGAIEGINNNADRALVDTVFDSLVRQLAIPNQWCQASAIHGFNHLKEPRCRPILREFAKNCEDPGLAEYARNAMTFQMM